MLPISATPTHSISVADRLTSIAPTLLLLTQRPDHAETARAYQFAKQFCQTWQEQRADEPVKLSVFCYGDGAYLANRFIWLAADVPNLAADWQRLVAEAGLEIQVCVTTALARGVTDEANARRHGLLTPEAAGGNLAAGFRLVGLGELAMLLHQFDAKDILFF